jgi:biopolymer transport protein ExbD
MADITPSAGSGKERKIRSRKLSTRIDMTPMVDLGFLLITFFMLATTLLQPVSLQLSMPDKSCPDCTCQVAESGTLTVLLDSEDRVFYYQGIAQRGDVQLQGTDFSATGIRAVLAHYKRQAARLRPEGLTVLIKASDAAQYGHVIDLIDELAINGIGQYALLDLTEVEKNLIKTQQVF